MPKPKFPQRKNLFKTTLFILIFLICSKIYSDAQGIPPIQINDIVLEGELLTSQAYADSLKQNLAQAFPNVLDTARFVLHSHLDQNESSLVSILLYISDSLSGRIIYLNKISTRFDVSFGVQASRLSADAFSAFSAVAPLLVEQNLGENSNNIQQNIFVTNPGQGTKISLSNGLEYSTTKDNVILLDGLVLRSGETFSVNFERSGYYKTTKQFTIPADAHILAAPLLMPESRLRYGISYRMFAPLQFGAYVHWFPEPDWLWLGVRLNFYGMSLNDKYWQILREQKLLAGSYLFFDPRSFFRTYLATSFGFQEATVNLPGTSPNLDIFTQPWILGLEANLPWCTLALETSYTYWFSGGGANVYALGYTSTSPRFDLVLGMRQEVVK